MAAYLEHPFERVVNAQWGSATLSIHWSNDSDSANLSFSLVGDGGLELYSFQILLSDINREEVIDVGPLVRMLAESGVTAPFTISIVASHDGGAFINPQFAIDYFIGGDGIAALAHVPISASGGEAAKLILTVPYRDVTLELG